MQSAEGGVSLAKLRSLAEQIGLHLSDQELAEVQRVYDPAQVAGLRALDLEPLEPASIYIPA